MPLFRNIARTIVHGSVLGYRLMEFAMISACRLNEGFAVYIEYKGVKSCEAGWDTDSKASEFL